MPGPIAMRVMGIGGQEERLLQQIVGGKEVNFSTCIYIIINDNTINEYIFFVLLILLLQFLLLYIFLQQSYSSEAHGTQRRSRDVGVVRSSNHSRRGVRVPATQAFTAAAVTDADADRNDPAASGASAQGRPRCSHPARPPHQDGSRDAVEDGRGARGLAAPGPGGREARQPDGSERPGQAESPGHGDDQHAEDGRAGRGLHEQIVRRAHALARDHRARRHNERERLENDRRARRLEIRKALDKAESSERAVAH